MYLSRHAQWTEILGGQQVIWFLDIHMDFNTHSWCVLLGLILNFWVYEHSAQERALLSMMQVLNLCHSTQILHVKQACRQQPLAL